MYFIYLCIFFVTDVFLIAKSLTGRFCLQLITDVNIAVAVEAVQAIGNLARGLRTHFSASSRFLLPVLLVSTILQPNVRGVNK